MGDGGRRREVASYRARNDTCAHLSATSQTCGRVNGIVAVTDFGWYEFLSQRSLPEVNFWKPSDTRRPHIPEFTPFFFQLKKKYRAIVGFAYFARWSHLPLWLAWDTFGEGNGCADMAALIDRVKKLRRGGGATEDLASSEMGCLLLSEPTFFARDQWVDAPADWSNEIVSGKTYDLELGEGRRIWDECRQRAAAVAGVQALPQVAGPHAGRWGSPQLAKPRLGQGTFRIGVLDAYGRACAITREHSLPVLEAAHIRSFSSEGPNEVRNGVLMRADLHRLFDKGFITISEDHRLEVSSRLNRLYKNGKPYYALAGSPVHLPAQAGDAPAAEFLTWHRTEIYRG